MKKTMVILAVMLMLCTCMLALAQENAFVGRWNEDSELGGSITLRSDGSFEGSVMRFYEMKGFYTLNDSTTATPAVTAMIVKVNRITVLIQIFTEGFVTFLVFSNAVYNLNNAFCLRNN